MTAIKNILSRNFQNFVYFYRNLRERLFIALSLNILISLLDGFGLAMFLPLLQMADGRMDADGGKMGNLGFLITGMHAIGLSITLHSVLLIIAVFFIAKGIAFYIQGVYQVKVQQYFISKIRVDNIRNLNKLDYKYFVNADVGRIQNTLTGEVDRVSRACQYYFKSFQMGVMVIVYMGFAFFVDWKFAIMVSIGGAATNLLYKQIYKNTKGRSQKLTQESSLFQGLIIQAVAHFKYLKATGRLTGYSGKLIRQVEHIEQNNLKIGMSGTILMASREPIIILVVCSVIIVQTAVLGSPLSVILVSLLFFYRALNALMLMQAGWNSFLSVSGSLVNMSSFNEELKRHKEKTGAIEFSSFKDSIALNNVCFNYDQQSILKNISLTIHKNETIAFAGESGSGKTTLINILSGLLSSSEGDMMIDGISRKEINIGTFQARTGYITQDPVIFNDSIYNNITLWAEKTEVNLRKFREACQQSAIDTFVQSLPLKEEAVLGNNGINLSGGQKQRISIARELFKEIDILILDEATSALDSETENEIQKNIEALKGRYTILIIAHRLSTIRNADRIVYMKRGEILCTDTFQGLTDQVEEFRKMVKLQEIRYDKQL